MTGPQALDEIDQILEDVDVFAFGPLSKEERVDKAKQRILKLIKEARHLEAQHWQSVLIHITKGFISVEDAKTAGYDRLKELER